MAGEEEVRQQRAVGVIFSTDLHLIVTGAHLSVSPLRCVAHPTSGLSQWHIKLYHIIIITLSVWVEPHHFIEYWIQFVDALGLWCSLGPLTVASGYSWMNYSYKGVKWSIYISLHKQCGYAQHAIPLPLRTSSCKIHVYWLKISKSSNSDC